MANAGTTDAEILSAIDDHFAPAVGTSDIAQAVGVTRQAADNRLRNLVEDGLVDSYMAGQTLVWNLTNAGERYLEDVP